MEDPYHLNENISRTKSRTDSRRQGQRGLRTNLAPHPEEPRAARRLEGRGPGISPAAVASLRPASFETRPHRSAIADLCIQDADVG